MNDDTERFIVYEPGDKTAGLAVPYNPNPSPHQTQFTVEQLWPDGNAEATHVGDAQGVAGLIEKLAQALDVHYMTKELEGGYD